MHISYDWLKEYIHIEKDPEAVGEELTGTGLEVEGLEDFEEIKGGLKGLVLGEVLTCEKHPDADKLSVTTVDVGGEKPLNIVCGAPNVAAGQKVVTAVIGTVLYTPEGEEFKIKKGKIRGQVSEGMICAEDEIGLGSSHDGIMVLDTDAPNGTPAAEVFELFTDKIFEIGLTPNRADAASHFGVARDLQALYDIKLCRPSVDDFEVHTQSLPIEIDVQNKEACPRYAGLSISGVKVEASPKWLQNRLKSIGLNPKNNVVDITNYILHAFGQPLHAFDAAAVKGQKVIVRTLPEGTIFTTLDEEERKLKADDLMICNGENEPMCIAGVLGGADSGVSENTTDVFLESAYFSPEYIRRTAKNHGIHTDASYRFARGTDPNICDYALKYAAKLICEIAGGKISSGLTDLYPEPVQNFEFEVKYAYLNKILGKEIEKEEIHGILTRLEIEVSNKTENSFYVSVPPYRVDVKSPADIAEEVLRIYGFNQIEISEHLSTDYLAHFPKPDAHSLERNLMQTLTGMGFSEMCNNSLVSSAYSKALGIDADDVEMLNPLSEDLDVMQQRMLFSGIESVARNFNMKSFDLRLFEFGKTYRRDTENEDHPYEERRQLILLMSGLNHAESWKSKAEQTDFYDLGEAVQNVLAKMNFSEAKLDRQEIEEDGVFTYGLELSKRTGKTTRDTIVKFGLVNRKLCKTAGFTEQLFYAEFDWDNMLKHLDLTSHYGTLSKFHPVRRDLSLVVPRSVSYAEIEKLAYKTEKKILKEISVFSVYEGENIEEGQKSYAVSFVLQDINKTLNDKTIDKTMNRLIAVYEKELGALIRR